MLVPSSSRRRCRTALLLVAAVLLASITGVSVANLRSATSSNVALGAGTLAIADSDGGAQVFALTGLRPGDTQSRCVTVTNTGGLSYGGLDLEATLTGTGLGDYLDIDVDRGSGAVGGASFSCSGFVLAEPDLFAGTLSAFDAGSPVQDPDGAAAGQTVSYRITIAMPGDVAPGAQGRTVELAIAWTARS